MDLRLFTTGVICTNTYCFLDGEKSFSFMDPGGNGKELVEYVKSQNGVISSVLLTHGHYDHIAGIRCMVEAFPNIKIYVHGDDAYRLGENAFDVAYREFVQLGIGEVVDKNDFPIPPGDVLLKDGDVILKGSVTFPDGLQVVSTPGHSPGSVCFFSAEKNIMFTGDTIFAQGSCGRIDCEGGDGEKLKTSLERILSFPDDVEILPGHGPASLLKTEKKFRSSLFSF